MKKTFLVLLLCCFVVTVFGDSDPFGDEYRLKLERNWLMSLYKGDGGIKTWQDAFGAVDGRRYNKLGFCTATEDLAWWQVDLMKAAKIGRVVVCNSSSKKRRTGRFELLFSL